MTKIQAIRACLLPGLVVLLISFSLYQHACLLRFADSFAIVPWSLHDLSIENPPKHTVAVSGATGAMYKMQRLRKYLGKAPAKQNDIATWHPPLADSTGRSFPMSEAWAVITTINPPTKTLRLLAEIPDLRLCVVADRKSPTDYELPGAVYLTPDMQVGGIICFCVMATLDL